MRSLLRRRTVQFALFIPVILAGWVASAGAGGLPPLPPPPITVPTVTIPTVTVPTVTVPTVTVPPVPQPPPVPPPQAPPPPTVPGVTVPSVQLPPPQPGAGDGKSSGGGGPAAPGGTSGTGGSSQSSGGVSAQSRRAKASSVRIHRLRLTRDWISISGPKKQRRTTLVFVLRRPALIEFVVIQVSPDCRRIGRFRVRGHRGVNRIPLRRSFGRHSLAPGTYRFVARALPGGRTVVDTRLVVVQRSSRREIRVARRANTCQRASDSGSGAIAPAPGPTVRSAPETAGDKGKQPARHRSVLGERFARRAFSPVGGIPVWLIALSTLAVGLLLTAALHPKAAPRELIASLALGMTGAVVLFLVANALL